MIYLKIVLEIVILFIAYAIGNARGYSEGLDEGGIEQLEMCQACEEDIFAAGFHAGVDDVLTKQEKHMQEIILTANQHIDKVEKVEPKKKVVKKTASKKVVKKNK